MDIPSKTMFLVAIKFFFYKSSIFSALVCQSVAFPFLQLHLPQLDCGGLQEAVRGWVVPATLLPVSAGNSSAGWRFYLQLTSYKL